MSVSLSASSVTVYPLLSLSPRFYRTGRNFASVEATPQHTEHTGPTTQHSHKKKNIYFIFTIVIKYIFSNYLCVLDCMEYKSENKMFMIIDRENNEWIIIFLWFPSDWLSSLGSLIFLATPDLDCTSVAFLIQHEQLFGTLRKGFL